jgi:RNA polymerase sigma-70 factor (ECF subfamily)
LVLKAGGTSTPEARHALDALCKTYWYPVYAFIRRKHRGPQDPLDLTQEYFCRLLDKGSLALADPEKGRFRSFLLSDCSHFLIDRCRWQNARVRNPGKPVISIDARAADGRYLNEPRSTLTPEHQFERDYALALLREVLDRLRQSYEQSGKGLTFEQLKVVLSQHPRSIPYAEIARRLDTTEEAIGTAVHRLRRRYKKFLLEEIAKTVSDPSDIEDEIRDLFRTLSS